MPLSHFLEGAVAWKVARLERPAGGTAALSPDSADAATAGQI